MLARRPIRRYRLLTAVATAACALLAGCAGLRCPRIDPTGEQCFIWPKDEVVSPVGVPAAIVPPLAGNPVAPPVVTDPFFPTVPAPAVAPAPATTTVAPASVAYPQVAQDRLSISPGRVLAPVGSEVVLKASICTPEGYTLANQEVEWMLGREGVGQFVELGGKGLTHPPLIPWHRGEKVDNYLARGYTADGPLCIDRGSADPTDDVNINRGDAWISVSSPNEGTSHVTAYTPAVESWDLRKAAATIYWVDAQWTFPPPAVTASGSGETLTTLVTRQTDGTPIEGWIVRYEVVGGPASEVRTGADGRAAVQVTPTGSGTTTQVNVQLLRPANFAGGDAPQLVIGNGTTVITWGGSQPYLPPSASPPLGGLAPSTDPIPQAPITPQPSLTPATGPRLELTVQGPQHAVVGGQAPLRITLRNTGDSTATGIYFNDQFDAGLAFPPLPGSQHIEKSIVNLAPGAVHEEELLFDVAKAGRLCHAITVSYAESTTPLSRQHCLTAVAPPPGREGGLRVNLDGPTRGIQGEVVEFKVTVKNTGQTALVNIVAEEVYPTGVLQVQPEAGVEVISGRVTRRVPRLEIGQERTFFTKCLCLQATRATAVLGGRAETDPPTHAIEHNDDHTLEILPPQASQTPQTPSGGTTPQQPTAAPLSVVVTPRNPELLVGARSAIDVTVTNKSAVADGGVMLRVYFPANVTPDPLAVQGPRGLAAPRVVGDALTFDALPSLAPNETAHYVIPFAGAQSGVVDITAQAVSRNVAQGAQNSARLEIIGNRR